MTDHTIVTNYYPENDISVYRIIQSIICQNKKIYYNDPIYHKYLYGRYISNSDDFIKFENTLKESHYKKILLHAHCDSGKTYSLFHLDCLKNGEKQLILAVPNQIQAIQSRSYSSSGTGVIAICSDGDEIMPSPNSRVRYCCTYDVIDRFFETYTNEDFSKVIFAVDEAHTLKRAKSYRKEAIDKIRKLEKKVLSCGGIVLYITATAKTLYSETFDIIFDFKKRGVNSSVNASKITLGYCEGKTKNEIINIIKRCKNNNIIPFIRLQNKKIADIISSSLCTEGINIKCLSSDDKNYKYEDVIDENGKKEERIDGTVSAIQVYESETYETIIKKEALPGYDRKGDKIHAFITTSMVEVGTNIKGIIDINGTVSNECAVMPVFCVLDSRDFDTDAIEQFLSRFRFPYKEALILMENQNKTNNNMLTLDKMMEKDVEKYSRDHDEIIKQDQIVAEFGILNHPSQKGEYSYDGIITREFKMDYDGIYQTVLRTYESNIYNFSNIAFAYFEGMVGSGKVEVKEYIKSSEELKTKKEKEIPGELIQLLNSYKDNKEFFSTLKNSSETDILKTDEAKVIMTFKYGYDVIKELQEQAAVYEPDQTEAILQDTINAQTAGRKRRDYNTRLNNEILSSMINLNPNAMRTLISKIIDIREGKTKPGTRLEDELDQSIIQNPALIKMLDNNLNSSLIKNIVDLNRTLEAYYISRSENGPILCQVPIMSINLMLGKSNSNIHQMLKHIKFTILNNNGNEHIIKIKSNLTITEYKFIKNPSTYCNDNALRDYAYSDLAKRLIARNTLENLIITDEILECLSEMLNLLTKRIRKNKRDYTKRDILDLIENIYCVKKIDEKLRVRNLRKTINLGKNCKSA